MPPVLSKHPNHIHQIIKKNSIAPCSKHHLLPTIIIQISQSPKSPSPKPAEYPPKHHHRRDDDPGQFEHGDFVPLASHDPQPPRAAFDAGRHVREGFRGVVDDVLVARVVVDVDGYGAQLGDFGLEGGEGVVVLPGWWGVNLVGLLICWRRNILYLSRS